MKRNHHTSRLAAIARVICIAGATLLLMGAAPNYAQGWRFGLGSGFTKMNIQGTQGYNIVNVGPVEYDIDLNPDEFNDVLESAFGFAGYATDATWMIQYSLGLFTLGGDGRATVPAEFGGGTLDFDLTFEVTNVKMTFGRTVYRSANMKFNFTPYIGLRYLKHDISADLVLTQAAAPNYIYRGRDWSWTDALVGLGTGYRFLPKFNWSLVGDAGFGGSNGSFYFTSSLTYTPTRHITLGPNFTFTAIDFENKEKGDGGWYRFDANELGAGIVLIVNF